MDHDFNVDSRDRLAVIHFQEGDMAKETKYCINLVSGI